MTAEPHARTGDGSLSTMHGVTGHHNANRPIWGMSSEFIRGLLWAEQRHKRKISGICSLTVEASSRGQENADYGDMDVCFTTHGAGIELFLSTAKIEKERELASMAGSSDPASRVKKHQQTLLLTSSA